MSKPLLALDGGMTNFKGCLRTKEGKEEPLIFPGGKSSLRSIVAYHGPDEAVFDEEAESMLAIKINHVFRYFKRQLGQEEPIGKLDDGTPIYADMPFKAIGSHILDILVQGGHATPGEPMDLILTVPDSWGDIQRGKLIQAYQEVGFNVVGLWNETTADLVSTIPLGESPKAVLFNIGGGTSDVVAAKADGAGNFEVLCHLGERALGSCDLDTNLARALGSKIQKEMSIEIEQDPVLWMKGENESERIKKRLSTRPQAKILLEINGTPLTTDITREDYEKVNEPVFEKFRELVRELKDTLISLAGEGSTAPLLDVIYTAGFGSIYPKFAQIIQEEFTEIPLKTSPNPGHSGAKGALILGPNMATGHNALPSAENGKALLRVEESIGSNISIIFFNPKTKESRAKVLIPKHTPIDECVAMVPATMPGPSTLLAEVTITEATEGSLKQDCEPYLDTWVLTVEKPTSFYFPEGNPPDRFEVQVKVNADSLIEVCVTDTFEGKSHSFTYKDRQYFSQ